MKFREILLSIVLFSAFCVTLGCKDDRSFKEGEGCSILSYDLAGGIAITNVDIYQGVRIQLMENGEDVTTGGVEVIAGKDALLRVHVQRQTEWVNRSVYVRVDLYDANQLGNDPCPIEELHVVDFNSDIATLTSTLNVEIPGDLITDNLSINISIREAEESVSAGGAVDEDQWPANGEAFDLNAVEIGDPLRIVLIPVQYNADGSGRLPDTSDAQLEFYYNEFFTQYPVHDIEFTVTEPFAWSGGVSANGGGWGELLNAITNLRGQWGAAPEEYYYGIVTPADSFGEFCPTGCVVGLSNLVTSPYDSSLRGSIGIGFPGQSSAATMIHEVGHAHGREHAPSGGAQGVDPAYPYSGGFIGVWGYDLVSDVLKNPASEYDFMGYADPTWVSDYTYGALYERITIVNGQTEMDMILPSDFQENWISIAVFFDGAVDRGPDLRMRRMPTDPTEEIEIYNSTGELIDVVEAYFNPYGHLGGGLLIFPDPGEHAAFAKLAGHEMVKI